MSLIKKIRKFLKKISPTVYIVDEKSEKLINRTYELPKRITISGGDKSNVVKIHNNLKARRINIVFSEQATNSKIFLDDSLDSVGLDIDILVLDGDSNELRIGKGTGMNGTKIWLGNGSKCIIGDLCRFSYDIVIRTTDGHTIIDNNSGDIINEQKNDCIIGDKCWIGLRSIINKNVQLAHDTIVGSGSIVTKKFDEPYTVIAGNPAHIIKTGVRHDKRTIYKYKNDMQIS